MRSACGIVSGVVGVVLTCAAYAPAEPVELAPSSPRLGINLAGPADWNTELPFVDVFRMSRPWVSQRKGAAYGQGPELDLDRFGWVKRLEADCFAEAPLCTIRGGHYPGGRYTVRYRGQGAIEFRGDVNVVASSPGRMDIEVDSSRAGFALRLMKTDPADPVRDIRVIMPGFESDHEQQPFHPAFLKRWSGMACYRFMDWMHTNGSEVRTWADRPTREHATFSKRGVALEWMIDLCNRQKIAAWFCMPHLADDDFVRRFAGMVKERLDPSLKVYLEYSNEVWNGQFAQSRHAVEQGKRLALSDRDAQAGWAYTAVRSMEIFAIWEDVFGGRERLVRVLPSQAGNTAVSEAVLSFRDAYRKADALAIAPYMPFTVGRGKLADQAEAMKDWDVKTLLDVFEATAFPESLERMRKAKAVADKYGLKLIAYEGGQHMVAMVKNRDWVQQITPLMHEANRHPRMGALYTRYFDEWARIGGDVFAVFSPIGRFSDHGAWGLAEFYDSQPSEYPKLEATLRWAKAKGQAVHIPD